MLLEEIYKKVYLLLRREKATDEGLWWDGIHWDRVESFESSSYEPVKACIDARLIAKLPGIDAEKAIVSADANMLREYQKWYEGLRLTDVRESVDKALAKIMKEIA